MDSKQIRGIIFIILSAVGYAFVAILGKWIFSNHLSMYAIMAFRFIGATLFFFFVSLWKKEPLSFREFLPLFLLGLIADGLQTSFFLIAVREVGASITTILLYTFPVFVLFIHRIFYKEKFTKIRFFSLMFSILGACLIINPFVGKNTLSSLGIACGIGTAILYAIYLTLSGKWTKNISTPLSSGYLLFGASTFFISLSLFENSFQIPATSLEWTLIGGFIVFGTIIPLYSLVAGIKLIGVVRSTFIFTIEPIATVIFAFFLFGETLTPLKILGSIFIFVSVVLSLLPSKSPHVIQEG
ncbi:MAG: DMT family transporter [Chlamydiota bacterium]